MKTSFEVVEWLNKKATDKEFLEVFAYLYESTKGRGITEREMSDDYLRSIFLDDSVLNSFKPAIKQAVENL